MCSIGISQMSIFEVVELEKTIKREKNFLRDVSLVKSKNDACLFFFNKIGHLENIVLIGLNVMLS